MSARNSLYILSILFFLLSIPGELFGVTYTLSPSSDAQGIQSAAVKQAENISKGDILAHESLNKEEMKGSKKARNSALFSENEIDDQRRKKLLDNYGKLPLIFIENNGQLSSKVKLYEQGSGHSTFFTQEGVFLSLTKDQNKSDIKQFVESAKNEKSSLLVRLFPVGGNKSPEIVAEDLQDGTINYFIGKDPEKWKTDLPAYGAVVYKEVYKGIDIKFYGNNRQLEYDVIVKPGADPSEVKLSYEGIEGLEVRDDGSLEISLKEGSLYQKSPYIYQEIDGKRVVVDGAFKLLANEISNKEPVHFAYSFEIASYDKSHPLIIDPIIAYSTYLGGSQMESGRGIAVDSAGNAYVTGYSLSNDFPLSASPVDPTFQGTYEAFVTKINPAGNAFVYSTYLGGNSEDYGNSIAVDSAGNAYVAGYTESRNFPLASPIDTTYQGLFEAFVTKINPAGNALIYSTYHGGDSEDVIHSIAIDSAGNAYLTGYTRSADFPLLSPIDATYQGSYESFVTKIDAAGSAIVYSTFLGGAKTDHAYAIAVDSVGNAYVTGSTNSADFPMVSPIIGVHQGTSNSHDSFVTKINAAGSAFVYSTFLGGIKNDVGYGIAVDSIGNAYVTGEYRVKRLPYCLTRWCLTR